MKSKKVVLTIVFVCLFAGSGLDAANTEISYVTTNLGSGRWEYNYTVINKPESLIEHIEEFTIWFDFGLYDNLLVTTPEPLASDWSEIVWDPEPVLEDDGAYDAVALTVGIGQDESVYGFSVSFDWLGVGEPGRQLYHIVDPENYPDPIEVGWTIPEPATAVMLGLGGILLVLRRGRHQL